MEEYNLQLKTSVDVAHIRKSCEVVSMVLREVEHILSPGISLNEIDKFCLDVIRKNNADSAIKGYRDFPGNVCISVNNVAAHGVPSEVLLQNGDILTIDCAVRKNGWYGDGAKTFGIGDTNLSAKRIIKAAREAALAGIVQAKAGNRLGDIGAAIEETAERYRCNVFRNFIGHGIGREIHEDPQVYHFGERLVGMRILPGMVFTIEPILSLGDTKTKLLADDWSMVTMDNSLSAQYEYTVAIFKDRTEILVLPETVPES